MKSFKDSEGRTWEIAINVATVRRVRGSVLKLDLMKLVDDGAKGLGELLADVVGFVDLIYVLCQSQAEQRGITDEDFGRGMGGDSITAAADAFIEEFIDFFPQPAARTNLRRLMSKSKEVGQILMDRGASQLEALSPQIIAERLISSLTTAPASLESTPVHLPSANSAA